MEKEFEWSCTITKCDNGYMITDTDGSIHVYEEQENFSGMVDPVAVVNMLCHVKSYFACHYSKHQDQNVLVEIEDNEQ